MNKRSTWCVYVFSQRFLSKSFFWPAKKRMKIWGLGVQKIDMKRYLRNQGGGLFGKSLGEIRMKKERGKEEGGGSARWWWRAPRYSHPLLNLRHARRGMKLSQLIPSEFVRMTSHEPRWKESWSHRSCMHIAPSHQFAIQVYGHRRDGCAPLTVAGYYYVIRGDSDSHCSSRQDPSICTCIKF